ncbi:MAG: DUF4129 domain-containing protein [Candidatus Hodarchaeales archaeon]
MSLDQVIVVNAKDFSFLGKKEFILLFLFLLTMVFSQIALEHQQNPNQQKPFLVIESSLLENLGILIPVFTVLFLFTHNRRNQDYSWLPPLTWILLFVLSFLALTLLPSPENFEQIFPEYNTTISTTIPETTTNITISLIPPPDTGSISDQLKGSHLFFGFIEDFRVLFIIAFLVLPLFLLFVIQSRSKDDSRDQKIEETLSSEERQKQFKMKTILECYLQASETLEDRGADKSPSITPTEFIDDVTEKRLTEKKSIGGITELYEEARFSNHKITLDKVAKAKEISRGIIESWWEEERKRKKREKE